MSIIAVTGATGQLGRLVIEGLKQKVAPANIVALVRDPKKAEALGVTVRVADYNKPADIEASLKQVDTLLLISSNEVGQRVAQHANVINAAKKAGVKRIVYTSLLRADTSPLELAPEHRETEALIKASGLAFTFLRNGWYYENNLAAIGAALQYGAVLGSSGEGRISFATREDFAAAAVAVLTSGGHENVTYELAGDVGYTQAEIAAEIASQSGKPVVYKDLPLSEYAAVLKGFGLPEGFANVIASCDVAASKGALYSQDHQLSKLIGRPTTSLDKAVAKALKSV